MLAFLPSYKRIIVALCIISTAFQVLGQPVLSFSPFITGLNGSVDIVNAGDGTNRLFIVRKIGIVRIHNGTSLLATPFINLVDTVLDNGEQGLLSLAFHPDYETNRYFFVWYTDKEGDLTLARYQTTVGDPNIADQNSEVVLLEIPKPGTPYYNNHNGGKINFGPDGYLYLSIGDGGLGGDPFNLAQDGNSLFGKMLRLDVNNFNIPPYYTIPADNPYVTNPTIRDEIWALGLRNPWRWSFDRLTGDMWIADVGQGEREEVNYRQAGNTGGVNYGWKCYEGNLAFATAGCGPISTYVFPVFDYPHDFSTGGYSVTGGNVYRGPDFPFLTGYYLVADFSSGNVWKIRPNGAGGWQTFQQSGLPGNIVGFGEAENGRLYAASLGGTVYLVEANTSLPLKLSEFTASLNQNTVQLFWKTAYEDNLENFEIEFSTDGKSFNKVGDIKPLNKIQGSSYSFTHTTNRNNSNFYRLRILEQNQLSEYSNIVRLNSGLKKEFVVSPTVISNGNLSIQTDLSLTLVQILAMDGKEVYRQAVANRIGFISVNTGNLKNGIYILRAVGNLGEIRTQKIVIQ